MSYVQPEIAFYSDGLQVVVVDIITILIKHNQQGHQNTK